MAFIFALDYGLISFLVFCLFLRETGNRFSFVSCFRVQRYKILRIGTKKAAQKWDGFRKKYKKTDNLQV